MSASRPVSSRHGRAWPMRLGAALAWGLAVASALYWIFKFQPGQAAAPGGVVDVAPARRPAAAVDSALVARALGTPDAAAPGPVAIANPVAGRLALVGVVAESGATRGAGQGAALIAVDGRPARPFRIGSEVEPGLYLQAVEARRVHLGRARTGAASVTLELPALRR